MAGEPVDASWTGWGIRVAVAVSFTVQVILRLLSDIRRRKGWPVLKAVIWLAYMTADTAAIYALGHMSALCSWSPHNLLMALWAPLLLVHLGGQENITAYSIEDNRLWLRHLQTFLLQVGAAGYVLHVSSILSHPSKLRSAAILMSMVGFLKYGERIWALNRADSCASSSLSATTYDKVHRTVRHQQARTGFLRKNLPWIYGAYVRDEDIQLLDDIYALLNVPKQMFEGPTSDVQIINVGDDKAKKKKKVFQPMRLVGIQLSMMYDLLYTKAAVVHTRCGFFIRVISLTFTITALKLFHSSLVVDAAAAAYYSRVDVTVTKVLLTGAVVLETMSVLEAIFSRWTAVLLLKKGRRRLASMVFAPELFITRLMDRLVWRSYYTYIAFSGVPMGQHSLFDLLRRHSNDTSIGRKVGRKVAKMVGAEDRWDSNVYSWSIWVPDLVIDKVAQLGVVDTTSQGLDAVRRGIMEEKKNVMEKKKNVMEEKNGERLVTFSWTEGLKLDERILVWHIATHVYINWYNLVFDKDNMWPSDTLRAAEAVANYMFFLLAARPYMLPYPVSRHKYLQLCSDAATQLKDCASVNDLLNAILSQMAAFKDSQEWDLFHVQVNNTSHENDTGTDGAQQPPPPPCVLHIGCLVATRKEKQESTSEDEGSHQQEQEIVVDNTGADGTKQPRPSILDRGCQLAAKLIHITAMEKSKASKEGKRVQKEKRNGKRKENEQDNIMEEARGTVAGEDVLNMVLEVWVEMLCYTAYLCNEKSHAKHLTDGGEIMTFIAILIIYVKNGFIIHEEEEEEEEASTSGTRRTSTRPL